MKIMAESFFNGEYFTLHQIFMQLTNQAENVTKRNRGIVG